MAVCQIHVREGQKEETKGQTDSEKTADLDTGKVPAHGCPCCFGTLGRAERKESAYEGAVLNAICRYREESARESIHVYS
jgi:hypothetical protein